MELARHLETLAAKAAALRERADAMDAEAAELRRTHGPAAGKSAGDGGPAGSDAETSGPASEPTARDIRTWARGKGLVVVGRGPIPADIVAQYKAAHPAEQG